jgi:hypothetical protein
LQNKHERRDSDHLFYLQQDEVGYHPLPSSGRAPPPSFLDVQYSQLQYLQQLSLHAAPPRLMQLVPKIGIFRPPTMQVEPMQLEEVSTPSNSCAQFSGDIWFEFLRTGSRSLPEKIDTGARVNVMSERHFHLLGLSPALLRPSPVMLVSFNQSLIQPLGMFASTFDLADIRMQMTFYVVPRCNNVLMCFRGAIHAQLLSPRRVSQNSSNNPVDALFIHKGETYSLVLADDAVPRSFPARKASLALEDKVKDELDRMEREGLITRVNEPTDWCSPMLVCRKPNGVLRVCMDPHYLNTFLKRATYPLPDLIRCLPNFAARNFSPKWI